MDIKSTRENVLIVTDKEYYHFLFEYKKSHPSINIKIIEKRQLLDKVGYTFNEDPIPFLIKEKNIEYSKAKQYVEIVRYLRGVETELTEPLKDYLTTDEYGLYELSKYHLYLFEMDEDNGVSSLLNRLNIKFEYLHFDDLEIPVSDNFKNPNIIYFSSKFSQFTYIFSDIRKRILEDKDEKHPLKNRLAILVKDDNDLFYVKTISKLFGIEILVNAKISLFSIPAISEHVKKMFVNKKIECSIDSEDEYLKLMNELIKKYRIDELVDFEYAYANLVEILSSQMVYEVLSDKGVVITNEYIVDLYSSIYVSNFTYGCFYKEYSDNNYLSDNELSKLGLTTSYQKTALDERKKLNYLKYSNIAILSRVKQHLSEAIYSSQFIKSLGWSEDKELEINTDGLFTKQSKMIVDAHQYDLSFYDKQIDDYRSFNHLFKGVKANELMEKDVWSITGLESFNNCPFKYYMDSLIPLPFDMHHMFRGTLIHKVFEKILHDDYGFEVAFLEGKQEYLKSMERKDMPLTPKEEAWIELYHHWLKIIVSIMLETKKAMKLDLSVGERDYEKRIEYQIGKYKFVGYIDKIIYTKHNDESYYTIVDYKTGHEEYNDLALAAGKCIQLPIYYYAIKNSPNSNEYTKGGKFGGFAIQHNYFSTIKSGFVDDNKFFSIDEFLKQTKYSGIALNSESYWNSFDTTSNIIQQQEDGSEVGIQDHNKAVLLDGKLSFNADDDDSILLRNNAPKLNRYNMNDVLETAKNAALRIIDDIINNRFVIAPSQFEIYKPLKTLDRLNCRYCNHANICFVNKVEDSKDYYSFIIKQLKKEEDQNG